MINIPLNFAPPTGQVQNTYAAPARTNPYLTSSQYEGMQLHTPSGLFYQGGNVYEPYTPTPARSRSYSPFGGSSFFGGLGSNSSSGGPVENSVKIGSQYFKPFTGNAQGIINGDLSMVSMLNKQPTYQPQGIPSNLLNFLSAPSMQPTNNQQSSGAGRFLGLLGSPITTNTQGK
jgi:hypothetical protein